MVMAPITGRNALPPAAVAQACSLLPEATPSAYHHTMEWGMARFTFRELDALSKDAILTLCDIDGLQTELSAGVSQRAEMIKAHVAWVGSMDEETLSSADWNSSIRSNFDLYSELRINGISFARIPDGPVFSIEDVDAMSDQEIMAVAEDGGLELNLSDVRRDTMLRAHAAWVETLSPDQREMYASGTSKTNWDLYSEVRINGIPPIRPTLVAAAGF
jgi:hypothetical protein